MDHNKSEGVFRLRNVKLPYILREIVAILSYFRRDDLSLKIIEAKGELIWDTGWLHNLGTSARLPVIAGLYGGVDSQTAFTYLAVGETATAVSAAHTALALEITGSGLARAAATVSRVTTTTTNDTTQLTKTWTASGSKTIEEIGYFNASSGGTMGGRALTGTKSVENGGTLAATYKIIHT